jgi:hypothetical protein
VLADLADASRWALVMVWTLATIEKASSLLRGSSAWHPLIVINPWRRSHAKELFASALVADVATLSLLSVAPRPGGVASASLIALYSAASLSAPPSLADGCHCFWRVLDATSRPALIARNAVLIALSLWVAVIVPHPFLRGTLYSLPVLGLMALATQVANRWSSGMGITTEQGTREVG